MNWIVFLIINLSATLWPPQLSPLRPTAADPWWWWTRSWTPALPSSGSRKLASASWSPATLGPKPACGWPVGSSLPRYDCCCLHHGRRPPGSSCLCASGSPPGVVLAGLAAGCSSALWLSFFFLKAPEAVPSCQRRGDASDWRQSRNWERKRAGGQSYERRGERHHLTVSHPK